MAAFPFGSHKPYKPIMVMGTLRLVWYKRQDTQFFHGIRLKLPIRIDITSANKNELPVF